MRLFSLFFLLGILSLKLFTFLPNRFWAFFLLIIVLAIKFLTQRWKPMRLVTAFLLGFSWCLFYSYLHLAWFIPDDLVGKPILISGVIATIPAIDSERTTFLFSINEFNHQHANGLVKLSWQYNDNHLRVGDQWQFVARLKKIHGMMNPGGFDYEAMAFQENIRATGYIIESNDNKLLATHSVNYLIDRIRQSLADEINQNLPISNTSPWITALAIGERQGISAENWQILRDTGTNHLMAIAGLHIGLMSGFMFALVAAIWRRIPALAVKLPAQHAGAIAACLMALIYSALAGFSLPTQRAVIMLCVFFVAFLLRRKILSWQAWSIALLGVLLLNPLSVLTDSFWLSFAAVALIIYGVSGRISTHGLWWKLGRIQWVIALGLIPFGIWLFQQFSFVSFIANSIAIPCVGFVIVPLTLFGCALLLFSVKLGGLMLQLADKILGLLWKVLTVLAHLHWASWYQVMPNNWILLSTCVAVILWLSPAGFPGKYFSLIFLLPIILYQATVPKEGEFILSLLDVGQGLSSVIQTKNHLLVFDAGPKLGSNFDMGESVVAPFLRSIGARKIDLLVISHGDNDHIGGSEALANYFPILETKTSVPGKILSFRPTYCLAGENWQWDGVNFTFLFPTLDTLNLDNNSSCVLKVSNQLHSVLLTGDIEKKAEKYLLATQLNNLPSEIMIAPHHGSKTSALNDFLTAIHPKMVWFPVGYLNRYHFPNPSVIEKYHELGVTQYDTVEDGAIQFSSAENKISLYRPEHKHYW